MTPETWARTLGNVWTVWFTLERDLLAWEETLWI